MAKERLEYIDAFKGLAILGIVLVHIPHAGLTERLILFGVCWGLFGFFFLSGWIMAQRPTLTSPGQHLKRRGRRFGRIYVYFTIVFLLLDVILILCGWYPSEKILKDGYRTLVLAGIGTLWFLPVLLFGETIVLAILSYRKYRFYVIPVCLLIIGVSIVAWTDIPEKLIASGRAGEAAVFPIKTIVNIGECAVTILIGYFSGKYFGSLLNRMYIKKRRYINLIVGLILISAGIFMMKDLADKYLILGRLTTVLPLSIGIMMVFMGIEKTLLSKFFSFWGRNSLIVMCTHYSITLVLIEIVYTLITGQTSRGKEATYIYLAACLLLTFFIIRAYEKIQLKRKNDV